MNLLKSTDVLYHRKAKRNTNLDKRRETVGKCESKGKEGFKNMRQTRDWEISI